MTSFGPRRAITRLLSVATTLFVVAIVARPLRAQISGDGWPFESDPQSQPKTPVEKKLEELYRRDGRPMPAYMTQGATAVNPPQQPQMPATGNNAVPPLRTQMQATTTVQWPVQLQRSGSSGSIRQQLSDYYGSQGKAMPQAQYSPNPGDTQPEQPKPTFRQRMGSFFGFSASESSSSNAGPPANHYAPSVPPQLSPQLGAPGQLAPSPMSGARDQLGGPAQIGVPSQFAPAQPQAESQPRPQAAEQPAVPAAAQALASPPTPEQPQVLYQPPVAVQPVAVQPPAAQPAIVAAPGPAVLPQPQPVAPLHSAANGTVYIDLGISQRLSPQPVVAPSRALNAGPELPQAPAATHDSAVAVGAIPPADVVAAKPAADSVPGHVRLSVESETVPADRSKPTARTVSSDDAPNPFHDVSEAEADKHGSPYTGLTLEDETVPKETAQRRSVSRADLSQPAHAVARDTVDSKTASPSIPGEAQTKSGPTRSAQSNPTAQAARPVDPDAPKSFQQPSGAKRLVVQKEAPSAKMRRIGQRVGQTGLKGFCPVTLRDQRDLADAKVAFCSFYKGRPYYFASAEAKDKFDDNPSKYAPVADGMDIVVKANSDQMIEGSLDYAAWYKQRLYLFSSPESLEAFALSPRSYSAGY